MKSSTRREDDRNGGQSQRREEREVIPYLDFEVRLFMPKGRTKYSVVNLVLERRVARDPRTQMFYPVVDRLQGRHFRQATSDEWAGKPVTHQNMEVVLRNGHLEVRRLQPYKLWELDPQEVQEFQEMLDLHHSPLSTPVDEEDKVEEMEDQTS